MGKGDRRTRRGKLYRGSFGKSRPKDPSKKKKAASAAAALGVAGSSRAAGTAPSGGRR